jgi:hypothetical protein
MNGKDEAIGPYDGFEAPKVRLPYIVGGSYTAGEKMAFGRLKCSAGENDLQNCKRLRYKTALFTQNLFNRLRNPERHFNILVVNCL